MASAAWRGGILCWNFDLHSFTHWSRTGVEIGANYLTANDLIHCKLSTRLLIINDLPVSQRAASGVFPDYSQVHLGTSLRWRNQSTFGRSQMICSNGSQGICQELTVMPERRADIAEVHPATKQKNERPTWGACDGVGSSPWRRACGGGYAPLRRSWRGYSLYMGSLTRRARAC